MTTPAHRGSKTTNGASPVTRSGPVSRQSTRGVCNLLLRSRKTLPDHAACAVTACSAVLPALRSRSATRGARPQRADYFFTSAQETGTDVGTAACPGHSIQASSKGFLTPPITNQDIHRHHAPVYPTTKPPSLPTCLLPPCAIPFPRIAIGTLFERLRVSDHSAATRSRPFRRVVISARAGVFMSHDFALLGVHQGWRSRSTDCCRCVFVCHIIRAPDMTVLTRTVPPARHDAAPTRR